MEIFWRIVTEFGNLFFWIIISFLTIYLYPFLPRKMKKIDWVFKLLLLSVLLSYSVTFTLKNIFKVPRPCVGESFCPNSYSFPSGRSTTIFSAITAIFLKFRRKKFLLLYLLAILVAYSRIALGVHTFYDIIGGALVGILCSFFTFKFIQKRIKINIDNFLRRKLLHLSFFLLFFISNFISVLFLQTLFSLITLTFLIFEILRLKKTSLKIYENFISAYTLENEKKSFLHEPFLFFLSLTLLLFLPYNYFLVGSIPLIIGDAFSALVGKFGKTKIFYNKRKTVEGSLAFFLSTFISLSFLFDLRISFSISLFSAFVESLINEKYENLILPFSSLAFYVLINSF